MCDIGYLATDLLQLRDALRAECMGEHTGWQDALLRAYNILKKMQQGDAKAGVCRICGGTIYQREAQYNDADGGTHHAMCFVTKRAETAEVALEQERVWRSRSFGGRHISEEESVSQQEREWEGFWKEVVTNERGELVLDSVKRELHDYSMMLENTSRVFNYVTGGLASKPNTDAQVIIGLSDGVNQDVFKREMEEYETDANRYRHLRQWHWSDGGLTVTHAENVKLGSDCPADERLDAAIDALILADEAKQNESRTEAGGIVSGGCD